MSASLSATGVFVSNLWMEYNHILGCAFFSTHVNLMLYVLELHKCLLPVREIALNFVYLFSETSKTYEMITTGRANKHSNSQNLSRLNYR